MLPHAAARHPSTSEARKTLVVGTVSVCLHAIPAGFALFLISLESELSGLIFGSSLAMHTWLVGFSLALPFASAPDRPSGTSDSMALVPTPSSPSSTNTEILALPPPASPSVSAVDISTLLLGALSPAIGVLVASTLPSHIVKSHTVKGTLLCLAAGLLLALALLHLSSKSSCSSAPSVSALSHHEGKVELIALIATVVIVTVA